jgi:hypothetical protein
MCHTVRTMCFSATASFTASGLLGLTGGVTLKKTKKPQDRLFAAIPLLFGVQQGIEGLNWLSDGLPALHYAATYGFVAFSHLLWPTYVPAAVWAMEPSPRRRKVMGFFFCLGVGVSTYILYYAATGGVTSIHQARGIEYDIALPNIVVVPIAYIVATCGSCLSSSHKYVRIFGMALFASLLITYLYYLDAFASVWCFFAAILSFIIVVHLQQDAIAAFMRTRAPAALRKA